MNIILLGPPGSGKGTQAARLVASHGMTHVSSGDLFRHNIGQGTELGKLAKGFMDRGDLVPDDVTVAMVEDRLAQPDIQAGVLLDGFPRTLPQAEALERMLQGRGQRIDAAILVEVEDEELVSRLSGRLICRECQRPFHQRFKPFQSCPESRCEGEHLYQRKDDAPETVRARLGVYREQTSPLIGYFESRSLLSRVDGLGTPDEVARRMQQAVEAIAQPLSG